MQKESHVSSHMEEYAQDYTLQELLVVAAAREVKDREVVFVGVGIPCLGALVAKLTHAPNVILAVESGCIGATPYRLMQFCKLKISRLCQVGEFFPRTPQDFGLTHKRVSAKRSA